MRKSLLSLPIISYCSVSQSCPTLTAACQASLSFTISQSLFKLMSIELVMSSNDRGQDGWMASSIQIQNKGKEIIYIFCNENS